MDRTFKLSKLIDTWFWFNPSLMLLLLSRFLGHFSLVLFFMFLPTLLLEFGYSLEEASLMLTVLGITNTVSRIVVGAMMDHPRISPAMLNLVIGINDRGIYHTSNTSISFALRRKLCYSNDPWRSDRNHPSSLQRCPLNNLGRNSAYEKHCLYFCQNGFIPRNRINNRTIYCRTDFRYHNGYKSIIFHCRQYQLYWGDSLRGLKSDFQENAN